MHAHPCTCFVHPAPHHQQAEGKACKMSKGLSKAAHVRGLPEVAQAQKMWCPACAKQASVHDACIHHVCAYNVHV